VFRHCCCFRRRRHPAGGSEYRSVDRVEQPEAHVSVLLPEERPVAQGVDDGRVAAGQQHGHPQLAVVLDQPEEGGHSGRVDEGDGGTVQNDGVELQLPPDQSLAERAVLVLLRVIRRRRLGRQEFGGLLLRLPPAGHLQEGVHADGPVQRLEEAFLVGVVQRRLEAEDADADRRGQVLVVLQVLVKIGVLGATQQRDLTGQGETDSNFNVCETENSELVTL